MQPDCWTIELGHWARLRDQPFRLIVTRTLDLKRWTFAARNDFNQLEVFTPMLDGETPPEFRTRKAALAWADAKGFQAAYAGQSRGKGWARRVPWKQWEGAANVYPINEK